VLCHVDAVAVVLHGDGAVFGIYVYIDKGDEFDSIGVLTVALEHADYVVAAIDDAFIEKLVEPGNVLDGFADNYGILVDPQMFVHILDRPNIRIGVIENVLLVGLLLVLLGEIHISS
jgi:hypothetical protein